MVCREEQVVVVERELLLAEDAFNGIRRKGTEKFWERIRRFWRTLARTRAEEDPEFKQIIPYTFLQRRGRRDDRPKKMFVARRKETQGEERLHRRLSLGIGGHMNPGDGSFGEIVSDNLYRELSEELAISGGEIPEPEIYGMINDDTNSVGRVHFGLVFRLHIPDGFRVEVREKEKMVGGWWTRREIRRQNADFESWSRLLFESLDE